LNTFSDSLFALILPMALRVGGEFSFDGQISKSLHRNFDSIVKELRVFDRTFRDIDLKLDTPQQDLDVAGGLTSSFFSGGLDSVYTAKLHKSDVLVSVHGFDISYNNDVLWGLAIEKINVFASRHGAEVIALKTNVREISNQFLSWGAVYHGAALGAIALSLPSHIRSTIVPSTSALLASKPGILGTGDSLCKLFSNMGRATITDEEKSRLSKIFELRREPEISELRVCWENTGGKIQCGTCFKCVLTTIELLYADVSIFPEGLSKKISVGAVLKLRPSVSQSYFLIEDYRASKELKVTSNVRLSVRVAIFWICTVSLLKGSIKKWLKTVLRPLKK
jgi:7-cyano-7-deazaguanine synthase in queuosine biosynthesis